MDDSIHRRVLGQQSRAAAAARRAGGQYKFAVLHHADLDRRVRILELQLRRESRATVRARLQEELDALRPRRDAAEGQMAAFGGVAAVTRARLVAERLRAVEADR